MSAFKRNAVILTVLLFVCVAVYLNWAYNRNGDAEESSAPADTLESRIDAQTETAQIADAPDAGLYYVADAPEETASDTVSEYFASVRLSREQARDSARETLASVSEAEGASQETIDAALQHIADVAETTMLEAELEGLIMAKGFEECVVFISDGGVSVTVQSPPDGMSTAAVARITDAVIEKTGFTADDLKIIEVK